MKEKLWKRFINELQNPPVTNKSNSEDSNRTAKLPWIPIVGPELRKAFKKKKIKTIFTSSSNLNLLLCQKHT